MVDDSIERTRSTDVLASVLKVFNAQRPEQGVALQTLTYAVRDTSSISDALKEMLFEKLKFLAEQAHLPVDKRDHDGCVVALHFVHDLMSIEPETRAAWEEWRREMSKTCDGDVGDASRLH